MRDLFESVFAIVVGVYFLWHYGNGSWLVWPGALLLVVGCRWLELALDRIDKRIGLYHERWQWPKRKGEGE
jgi:hypothetical protein